MIHPDSPKTTLPELLEKMWNDYIQMNPQAKSIYDLFTSRGEKVINDHIALRTFDHPKTGIDVLAKSFLDSGYKYGGEYEFKEKKLFAKHFIHPDKLMPKVFISELLIGEFSKSLQESVNNLIAQIPSGFLERFDLSYAGRPWNLSYAEYEALASESEYAGWLASIGFRPNHFTVSVNHLKSIESLSELNQLIKDSGFLLNSSGGEIKGSKDVLLEQSSTLADSVKIDFSDGAKVIPSCYYEFAKRYPQADGELYQGFVAASADKIFESTDRPS